MRVKKGATVQGYHSASGRTIQFKAPSQMCDALLKRYVVQYLGEDDGDWKFIEMRGFK